MNMDWARRRWLDFRMGHGTYLIFMLSFANFILIFHRLLIERVSWLDAILGDLTSFIVLFVVCYIPVAILVGSWHRRTQHRVESDALFVQSPLLLHTLRTILDVADGSADRNEVKRLREELRKYDGVEGA